MGGGGLAAVDVEHGGFDDDELLLVGFFGQGIGDLSHKVDAAAGLRLPIHPAQRLRRFEHRDGPAGIDPVDVNHAPVVSRAYRDEPPIERQPFAHFVQEPHKAASDVAKANQRELEPVPGHARR